MTEKKQEQEVPASMQAGYDLADQSILEELFEVVLYDVIRRMKQVHAGEIKQEEASAMDKQSAAFMAGVLAGKNEQFIPKRYWSGDPLAGYLRILMKNRFERVGVTQTDLSDTRGVLQSACFEFVCDVYALARQAQVLQSTEKFQAEGKRLCRMWAQRMLGRREDDPVQWTEN